MEDAEKKMDGENKENTEQGKRDFSQKKEDGSLEVNFNFFISSLGMQTMIALGEMVNPITNKKEEDLKQAKYLIDLLGIIKEKTKNNLDREEEEILDNLLYQLRTLYIKKNI